MPDQVYIEIEDIPPDEGRDPLERRLGRFVPDGAAPAFDPALLHDLPRFDEGYREVVALLLPDRDRFFALLAAMAPAGKDRPFLRVWRYDANDRVIAAGDRTRSMFWLLAGRLEVRMQVEGGMHKVGLLDHPGECFGELGALLGAPRSADIVAGRGGAQVLEVDWGVVRVPELPELNAFFHAVLSATLADKLSVNYQRPIQVARKAARRLDEAQAQIARLKAQVEGLGGNPDAPPEPGEAAPGGGESGGRTVLEIPDD